MSSSPKLKACVAHALRAATTAASCGTRSTSSPDDACEINGDEDNTFSQINGNLHTGNDFLQLWAEVRISDPTLRGFQFPSKDTLFSTRGLLADVLGGKRLEEERRGQFCDLLERLVRFCCGSDMENRGR